MTEYEYVRLELQREVNSKSEFIASGNCKTFDNSSMHSSLAQ